MANMIYTTYQKNSYKIIKSTFNTYELPHAPVIFSTNFSIFNCLRNLTLYIFFSYDLDDQTWHIVETSEDSQVSVLCSTYRHN